MDNGGKAGGGGPKMKYLLMAIVIVSALFPAILTRLGREMLLHPGGAMDGKQWFPMAKAMRNQDTWAFAQHTSGVICHRIGLALTIFTGLFFLLLAWWAEEREPICAGWWLLPAVPDAAALLAARLLVERALKKNFDENGRRLYKEDQP